jgi:hypothetical protein
MVSLDLETQELNVIVPCLPQRQNDNVSRLEYHLNTPSRVESRRKKALTATDPQQF